MKDQELLLAVCDTGKPSASPLYSCLAKGCCAHSLLGGSATRIVTHRMNRSVPSLTETGPHRSDI